MTTSVVPREASVIAVDGVVVADRMKQPVRTIEILIFALFPFRV